MDENPGGKNDPGLVLVQGEILHGRARSLPGTLG
jgi:hypothetical protein